MNEDYLKYLGRKYSLFDYIGKIGVFGDLTFQVENDFAISPGNGSASINKSATYNTHSVLGKAPYLEFANRNLIKVKFNVKILNYVDNITTLKEKLDRMVNFGEVYPLIVGSEALSENKFALESFDENINLSNDRGDSINSEFQLSFSEYIEDITRGEEYSPNIKKSDITQNKTEDVEKKNSKKYEEAEKKLW